MEGAAGAAPPGWYTNPEQPDQLRWWDGQAWTDHTAQTGQPPTPAFTASSDPLAGLGKGRKKATEAELADGEEVLGAWRAGMPTSAEALICTDKRVIVIKRDVSTKSRFDWTGIGAAADRLFAPNTVTFGPSKKRKAAAEEAARVIQTLIERAAVARETATSTDKACPRCAETIKGAALVCRYCGHHL